LLISGGSGLPTTDSSKWDEFRNLQKRLLAPTWKDFNEWVISRGAPALKVGELHPQSPWANIYMTPEEIDYLDLRPLPPKWNRFDSLVRISDEKFELPNELKSKSGKLVYVSMGSFASAELTLMRRLVETLGKSPNRFIFSKGNYQS
jgi:UDP:flavonoid glycosyltransferase YjiC (YdhE family)